MPMIDETQQVRCKKCRNIHRREDREASEPNVYGLTSLVCPVCGEESYYLHENLEKDNHGR